LRDSLPEPAADRPIGADSATRSVALVLGINAATDDPHSGANGTAVPA